MAFTQNDIVGIPIHVAAKFAKGIFKFGMTAKWLQQNEILIVEFKLSLLTRKAAQNDAFPSAK